MREELLVKIAITNAAAMSAMSPTSELLRAFRGAAVQGTQSISVVRSETLHSMAVPRPFSFLANMKKETGSAKGLGVDATTALVVESNGQSKVLGLFNVYFVTPTEAAAVDGNGNLTAPLTMNNIKVRRVDKDTAPFQLGDGWNVASAFGLQYTLTARPKPGDVTHGELISDRPSGDIY